MTSRTATPKHRPSLWAVGLFVLSTAFFAMAIALFATDYPLP